MPHQTLASELFCRLPKSQAKVTKDNKTSLIFYVKTKRSSKKILVSFAWYFHFIYTSQKYGYIDQRITLWEGISFQSSKPTSHTPGANKNIFINTASLKYMESSFAIQWHYNIAGNFNDEDHITQTAIIFPLLSNNSVTYLSYGRG